MWASGREGAVRHDLDQRACRTATGGPNAGERGRRVRTYGPRGTRPQWTSPACPRLDTKAQGAEPVAGRRSGGTGGGPGSAGMDAAEPVEVRADAADRLPAVGPGGGPGPVDIRAGTGVTVADSGLGHVHGPEGPWRS